jgi:hypothetical protein
MAQSPPREQHSRHAVCMYIDYPTSRPDPGSKPGKIISIVSKCPHWLLDPPTLSLNSDRSSLPGVKPLGSDVDCTGSSIAVAEHEWIYTSTPSIRLHDMYRDKFISYRNSHVLLGFSLTSNNIRSFKKQYRIESYLQNKRIFFWNLDLHFLRKLSFSEAASKQVNKKVSK